MNRLDIDKIRKKMTRENFLIYGSCPCNYGLEEIHRNKCSFKGVSTIEFIECKKNAIKNIKFKDDEEEPKKYAGWEIVKMIVEKQLKEGTRVIWNQETNTEQVCFTLAHDGCLYSAKYYTEAGISFFVNAVGHDINGYFTIEEKEYMTFKEAQKLGTPKHKTLGYSYQDYKVREFIENMDRKVWYI